MKKQESKLALSKVTVSNLNQEDVKGGGTGLICAALTLLHICYPLSLQGHCLEAPDQEL